MIADPHAPGTAPAGSALKLLEEELLTSILLIRFRVLVDAGLEPSAALRAAASCSKGSAG